MKFCPECGVKLDNDNFKFCPECGYKVGSDTNSSNTNKSGGFVSSFIKRVRDEIPNEYFDKIKDNETIDDVVTHAKIILHGPQTEKEKEYRERKNKEKESKKQDKERKRKESIELRRKYNDEYEKREAEKCDKKASEYINQETNNPVTNEEVTVGVKDVPEEQIIKESVEKETEVKLANKIEAEKYKKETSTKQIKEIDYSNLNLSDLQETLIKSLPIINNPSEYEENIIKKYADFNFEERKELLKDCWTINKLAEEHNIKRQEVQKSILADEFIDKDLIGIFKVNPNNIRSLKILYRKPVTEINEKQETEKYKEEQSTLTSNKDVESSVTNEEVIKELKKIPEEPVVNEPVEEEIKSSQEKTNNVSTKFTQDNKNDNNEKKQKKGIVRKIMDFNLGKIILDKGEEKIEEEKREVLEKISPLLPEYARVLNTTPDKLYVTSISESFRFGGGEYNPIHMFRDGVVISIEDTQISYILFGRISDKVRFLDSMDTYSISFKNIVSISDRVLTIEFKMQGDNTISIQSEDYFGKRFLNELLRKYNKFNSDLSVTKNNSSNNDTSKADELLKYAELYKQDLLTEEEFETKKKELL